MLTSLKKITSAATTFRVCDNNVLQYCPRCDLPENEERSHEFIKRLPGFKANNCTEVLQTTNFTKTTFPSRNGFVFTVVECYNTHHNLVIRPDDIWVAIMTQFSTYVSNNADKFRDKFVSFEGKKELVVEIDGILRNAPYDTFVKLMTEKIDENLIDSNVKKWILPSFSTTTENDVISTGVIFMASMKKYFDYTCGILCGIPKITLEGTIEDWKDIYRRLEKLKEYELTKWFELLEPILRQFIDAKQGNVDKDFWQTICHVRSLGSGDDFLSGWIVAFCIFDDEGIPYWEAKINGGTGDTFLHHVSAHPKSVNEANFKEESRNILQKFFQLFKPQSVASSKPNKNSSELRIDIPKIPCGVVEWNVKIQDGNNATYDGVIFGGHVGIKASDDRYTLNPAIGWAIALKQTV